MTFLPLRSRRSSAIIHVAGPLLGKHRMRALCGTAITGGYVGGMDRPTCPRCIERAKQIQESEVAE